MSLKEYIPFIWLSIVFFVFYFVSGWYSYDFPPTCVSSDVSGFRYMPIGDSGFGGGVVAPGFTVKDNEVVRIVDLDLNRLCSQCESLN